MRARLGAFALHAKYGTKETTRAATAGFLARFEREVDPDCVLDPVERNRRAISARRAHMTSLALKSSIARSAKLVAS
jgi:hypothetical protein